MSQGFITRAMQQDEQRHLSDAQFNAAGNPSFVDKRPKEVPPAAFLREKATGVIHYYSPELARHGDLVEAYEGALPGPYDQARLYAERRMRAARTPEEFERARLERLEELNGAGEAPESDKAELDIPVTRPRRGRSSG